MQVLIWANPWFVTCRNLEIYSVRFAVVPGTTTIFDILKLFGDKWVQRLSKSVVLEVTAMPSLQVLIASGRINVVRVIRKVWMIKSIISVVTLNWLAVILRCLWSVLPPQAAKSAYVKIPIARAKFLNAISILWAECVHRPVCWR